MIPEKFKPMLADKLPEGTAPVLPCLVSPKLDGIRAVVFGGVVYSRNLKPIPNGFVQKLFGRPELEGFDGELLVGCAMDADAFRATTSGIMSADGEPDVVFHVFDLVGHPAGFAGRLKELARRDKKLPRAICMHVQLVPHDEVKTLEELHAREADFLTAGFEGLMVRAIDGPYKFGRSTAREGYLLKVKRFCDGEARIIQAIELEHNHNELTRDELGRSKRTTHKAGKVAGGTLGTLEVKDVVTGIRFGIGSGFSAEERATLWADRHNLPNRLVKYRYFPTGSKEAPRFPTWQGFRAEIDA